MNLRSRSTSSRSLIRHWLRASRRSKPVADFDAIAADFVAHSDAQWKLPLPPPSSGTISYQFRDDAGRMSRTVSVGTLAALALQLESPGPGKPPQALVAIDDEFRIDVDARFLDGADVGVELLAPWGESDETLLDFVRAYYLDVTHDPAAANAAAEKFIAENGDVLPGERPQNWGFSMEPGAFSGQAGGREFIRADRLPRQRGGHIPRDQAGRPG